MKNILKQLFSLILPFTVLVLVPLAIENKRVVSVDIFLITGLILVVGGIILLIGTVSMFIRIGKGTLAPWSPTGKLVLSGVYAYTRNPMISGVLAVLLGESLMFHSITIFTWFVSFFIINSIYFVLSEEPGLVKRFGQEYLEYKRNVPRWIPRFTPWKPRDGHNNHEVGK
jgi:protein-S-isoprenylcysteine O-methyltransferase Ste14